MDDKEGQFHFESHNVFSDRRSLLAMENGPTRFLSVLVLSGRSTSRLRTPKRRGRAICVIGSNEITRGTLMQMRSKWKLGRISAGLSRL